MWPANANLNISSFENPDFTTTTPRNRACVRVLLTGLSQLSVWTQLDPFKCIQTMSIDTGMRLPYKTSEDRLDCAPLHPGEVLREDILPHYRLSTADLARALGVSRSVADDLVAEKRDITIDLATLLATAFNVSTHYWLALQKQYDLWHASQPAMAGQASRGAFHALHAA